MRLHVSHRALCLTFALAIFAGCGAYDLKVNDRVVYRPAPLFADYTLADENLATCVTQHIEDQQVRAVAELTRLNCAHAGIASLDGLQLFTALRELRLSHNAVSDIGPLVELQSLVDLRLDNNRVEDASPLSGLVNLQILALQGNANMACASTQALFRLQTLSLPEHCSSHDAR